MGGGRGVTDRERHGDAEILKIALDLLDDRSNVVVIAASSVSPVVAAAVTSVVGAALHTASVASAIATSVTVAVAKALRRGHGCDGHGRKDK